MQHVDEANISTSLTPITIPVKKKKKVWEIQSLFSSARRLKQWEPFLSICHISTLNILNEVPVGHLAEVTNKYWIHSHPLGS